MSEGNSSSNSGGGCGCISIIATVLVLWALFFGVTVGGKHYELRCSDEPGVVIE
jgi:hypothetical protein